MNRRTDAEPKRLHRQLFVTPFAAYRQARVSFAPGLALVPTLPSVGVGPPWAYGSLIGFPRGLALPNVREILGGTVTRGYRPLS
jgi:hypothetical protein